MKVLGIIGGWDTFSHDAAAAAVENGVLRVAIEEERLVRDKLAFGLFPHHAVSACLEECGWSLGDVDAVAIGWDQEVWARHGGGPSAAASLPPTFRGVADRVVYVDHHDAHLASAAFCVDPVPAAGLVIDGHGERRSVSLYEVGPRGRRILGAIDIAGSPGLFYDAVATYCGLGTMSAGKLMGLAAYGSPRPESLFEIGPIRDPSEIDGFPSLAEAVASAAWPDRLARGLFPHAPCPDGRGVMMYADIAATAQRDLEVALLELVRWLRERVPHDRLLCSGGVFLNCCANTRIAEEGGFADVRVFAAANDAGAAAGAAAEIVQRAGRAVAPVTSLALGRLHHPDEVRRTLARWGLSPRCDDPDTSLDLVAERLARGGIVLFFDGRAEFGPRALCQRSILSSPASQADLLRLNRFKRREPWRPLAPVLLDRDYEEVFETEWQPTMSTMLATARVRPEQRARLVAITHVDGTSRPQVVDARSGQGIVRVLEGFRARTGMPCLVNTSMNIAPEPIAEEPADALRILQRAPEGTALFLHGLFVDRRE